MTDSSTKQKVIQVASRLFYQKGFAGTSVRNIASEANVNVSLISYYFKSKQGLLEYAVTAYYEEYLQMMEKTSGDLQNNGSLKGLKQLIVQMLSYRLEHYQLTSFIHRELSLDSTFVREMSVTYLAKENHILSNIFYAALPQRKTRDKQLLYMQLKGMLLSPFIQKSTMDTVLFDNVERHQFVKDYTILLGNWLDFLARSTPYTKM